MGMVSFGYNFELEENLLARLDRKQAATDIGKTIKMIALSDMNLYLKAKKDEDFDEGKYSKKIRAYTEKIMSDLFEDEFIEVGNDNDNSFHGIPLYLDKYVDYVCSIITAIVDGVIVSWNLEEVDLVPLKRMLRQINEMVGKYNHAANKAHEMALVTIVVEEDGDSYDDDSIVISDNKIPEIEEKDISINIGSIIKMLVLSAIVLPGRESIRQKKGMDSCSELVRNYTVEETFEILGQELLASRDDDFISYFSEVPFYLDEYVDYVGMIIAKMTDAAIASKYLEKDNKNFNILVELLHQINDKAKEFRTNAYLAHEIVDMMSDYGDNNNNELKK